MDSKRIERLLVAIIILLVLDVLVHFQPYQVTSSGLFGYRLNCYTGEIVEFNASGITGPLKRGAQ